MKKLVFQSHFLVQIFSVDEVNKCVWEMLIFDFLSHKQQQNSFFVKKKDTINETTFVHSVYAFRLNSSFYEIIFCHQTTKFLTGTTIT